MDMTEDPVRSHTTSVGSLFVGFINPGADVSDQVGNDLLCDPSIRFVSLTPSPTTPTHAATSPLWDFAKRALERLHF